MSKIVYDDKKDFIVNPTVLPPNKITSGDMNEIKNVVNNKSTCTVDNIVTDINLSKTRVIPTVATTVMVQFVDTLGNVVCIETSATNVFCSNGKTVQEMLEKALYIV